MKVRFGFVSNSSSASFMIPKSVLSGHQMDLIRNHFEEAKKHPYLKQYTNLKGEITVHTLTKYDKWKITETEHSISGRGYDNIDMRKFLEEVVRVDPGEIFFEYT